MSLKNAYVNEMVPLGASEDVLDPGPRKTEQPPTVDLVDIRPQPRARRKALILLAIIGTVIITSVFVGIFVAIHKSKDEENTIRSQGRPVEDLASKIQNPSATIMKLTPSAKFFSTLSHQTQLVLSTPILTSSDEAQFTVSACSTCDGMSRGNNGQHIATLSPLLSISQLVPNAEAKWSRWSPWSQCTKSCGNGTRFRTRTCVGQNQRAVFAPISCAGKSQQTRNCSQWSCPDCRKVCQKGTLNDACDVCTCDGHILTGRVQAEQGAPIAGAKIALAETPYKPLTETDDKGFFKAFNVCADSKQEFLISAAGFVPIRLLASISTPTTANMKAQLEMSVPPTVTVHPQSKMRFSGDRVTLCCDGEGNPPPEFEWFKDDNIIDKDIYYYDKNLEISNVTGMMGKYRCRLVNDYGSEFSDVADLRVFSKANASSPGCNPTPRSKNTTLPTGCVVDGTTTNIIDVGECRPTPCLRNDSILSKRTCQDENFCCTVTEVSDVTVNCGSSITFTVSKASRCGCQKCAKPKLLITGIVVGRKGQTEKPITYSDLTFDKFKYRTKGDGSFSFEVLTGKKRLSVVFKDTYHNEYADLTKVFHITNGKTLFSKIVLRPKPEPRFFNSSEPSKVQLGQGKNDKGFAEMIIPKDSLLKDDGTPFSGQANLRLNVVNPRNMSDMETAPGDFSTIDEEGEEQMLVSSGMLNLDFEDDSGKKLSPFKPIKLYLDPEKLNISVDSNGNTTTKLWWLDSKTGRWVAASDVRMVKKISSKAKRSPTHFLLETEIVPSISRQGQFNIDVVTNFGAVRAKAPTESSIRILCEELNVTPKRYTGYLEETVGDRGVVCITVWIDRKCYMQGESTNATYLEPEQPDDFPPSISAAVIGDSNINGFKSGVTFSFNVKTSSDGPIFPRNQNDFQNCRNVAGLKQFEFNPPPASSGFDLQSKRINNPRNSRNWYPEDFACFIKILANGARSSIFLASSHRPNKGNKYGDSAAMAQKVQGSNAFVACLEIRCPGNVYHPNRTPDQIPEWTHVLVTHLTGNCDFRKNFLRNQDDLDNKGTKCPTRSKRHSPGSETWLCVPLRTSGFDTDLVYTGDKNFPFKVKNKCLKGNEDTTSPINTKGPTVEFSCT